MQTVFTTAEVTDMPKQRARRDSHAAIARRSQELLRTVPLPEGHTLANEAEENLWRMYTNARALEDWTEADLILIHRVVTLDVRIAAAEALIQEEGETVAGEVNVRLHGYEVDLLWRDARLIIELDGSEYHDPEHDTRRDNNLRRRGWTTIRFTWRQVVNDPDWVVENLAS